MRNGYIAFVLDDESRTKILQLCGTKYPDVIAHHITIQFGVEKPTDEELHTINELFHTLKIVGYAADDKVETLVCWVDGSTIREDGKLYHLTLSIDRSKGAKPAHSKNVLASGLFTPIFQHEPLFISGKVEFIFN